MKFAVLFSLVSVALGQLRCDNLTKFIELNSQYGADGVFNGTYFPAAFKDIVGLHVPQVFVDGTRGYVQMDFHPQTAAHYITDVYVFDERHRMLQCRKFNATGKNDLSFAVPTHTGSIRVYENCNLHGVWEAAVVEIRCDDLRKYVQENFEKFKTPGVFNATHFPASLKDVVTLHIPTVTISADHMSGTVTLPGHPMTEDHHITDFWVVDERGRQIGCDRLSVGATATLAFNIEPEVREIRVLEHCNLHGLWETARINVTALRKE